MLSLLCTPLLALQNGSIMVLSHPNPVIGVPQQLHSLVGGSKVPQLETLLDIAAVLGHSCFHLAKKRHVTPLLITAN